MGGAGVGLDADEEAGSAVGGDVAGEVGPLAGVSASWAYAEVRYARLGLPVTISEEEHEVPVLLIVDDLDLDSTVLVALPGEATSHLDNDNEA